MVSMPHSLLWDLYFAHARPPAVVVAIGVRSQCSPVGIEVEICPTTLRGLPTRYGYNACRSPHPRCTPGLNRNLGYLSRPQQPRTRTLLDPQTPIPPPPPPQLCSRHVSEPGYPPRGRGGKKRTCSRPHRTTYLPLRRGCPAAWWLLRLAHYTRHTCGVVSCRFQGGPSTLAHEQSS